MGLIPGLTERVTCNKVLRQMMSELFNSTLLITPASKFASLELSPTAPTAKAANDSQKNVHMGPGGLFFFPAVWISFTFATGWVQAFRYSISLAFVCARNDICLKLKTPGMTCRPEMTI